MKTAVKLSLSLLALGACAGVLFQNCGEGFEYTDATQVIESSKQDHSVPIITAESASFKLGSDLEFSVQTEGLSDNAEFEWSNKPEFKTSLCQVKTSTSADRYLVNCSGTVGKLEIDVLIRDNSKIIDVPSISIVLEAADSASNNPLPDVVFVIAAGTGRNAWNTPDNPIRAKVGQKIIFQNNDTIPQRLHTGGRPCPHGASIAPGASMSCLATTTYTPNGSVYSHNVGPSAPVYIVVTQD